MESLDRNPFSRVQTEALEARVRWLEEELARARSSLKALGEESGELPEAGEEEILLAGSTGDVTPPQTEEGKPFFLAPLLPHEEVCVRWKLGEGLPEPRPGRGRNIPLSTPESPTSAAHGAGYLRLFGLLPSGQPWKCSIPFADLMRPGGVLLGRSPEEADIVLDESSVSRRHARLELCDNGLVITDEESTNGVFVDGCRLSPYERRVALSDGITVAVGEVVLRVEIISPLSPSTQAE